MGSLRERAEMMRLELQAAVSGYKGTRRSAKLATRPTCIWQSAKAVKAPDAVHERPLCQVRISPPHGYPLGPPPPAPPQRVCT